MTREDSDRGHSAEDGCKKGQTCKKCGRTGWQHQHSCGVRVCPHCYSMDVKLHRESGGCPLYWSCGLCGAGFDKPMDVNERLSKGA